MREPPDAILVLRVRVPLAKPRICGSTCPSSSSDGPLSLGYRLSGKPRAGSNPAPAAKWLGSQLVSCPSLLFDGSQDWVIAHNDVVAGSSPVSGTKYRSSSVVEHVNSQFVSYPSALSAGRRLWVLVDPAVAVQVRPEEQSEVV